jgi:hypothetical protein
MFDYLKITTEPAGSGGASFEGFIAVGVVFFLIWYFLFRNKAKQ